MDTTTNSAVLRKLQGRTLALRVVAGFICIAMLFTRMNVFAAETEEDEDGSEVETTGHLVWGCSFTPQLFGRICLKAMVPPTCAFSYEDRKRSYEYSDAELLAMYQVVQAEAGAESMRGKVAVAAVILNRYFGDNAFRHTGGITSLIVPGQFARSGYSYEWFQLNNPDVIQAVSFAISGYDPTAELYEGEGALYFYADWNNGRYEETKILNEGTPYRRIVIDRQCYYQ